MKKILTAAIFLLIISEPVFCQEVKIQLAWGRYAETSFEGAIVLPAARNEDPEIIKGTTAQKSANGNVRSIVDREGTLGFKANKQIWEIDTLQKGIYKIFVSNQFMEDDLSNWWDYSWEDQVGLKIKLNEEEKIFSPPASNNQGIVWHVANIIGETKEIVPVNLVLPRKKTVYGVVKDAASGNRLSGVKVILRDRNKNKVIASEKTSDRGVYMFFVKDQGDYDVIFEKENYIEVTERARFMTQEFPYRIDPAMTALLKKMQYRIVVSWGNMPPDMDAHLTGPMPDTGGKFHISYNNMKSYADRHTLDVDDRDGFGPETITVTRLDPGTYRFSVHDYTNRNAESSRKMSYSGLAVLLYRESELVNTFRIQEGAEGNLWQVFEINGDTGEIMEINQMSYQSDDQAIE